MNYRNLKQNIDSFILCSGVLTLTFAVSISTYGMIKKAGIVGDYKTQNFEHRVLTAPGQTHLAAVTHTTFDVDFAEFLKGIDIQPYGETVQVEPGEVLRMTAMGIYTTWEQLINANWSVYDFHSGKDLPINDCVQTKTCEYSVPASEQQIQIYARAAGVKEKLLVDVKKFQRTFSDNVPTWAAESVSTLSSLGIIRGYDDGRFGAADPLTRGQVITLLYRTLMHTGLQNEPTNCLQYSPNVPDYHFAFQAICLFHVNGWESGAYFNPDEEISRGETAAYINRIFGPSLLTKLGTTQGQILTDGQVFPDVPTSHWHFFDVGVANKAHIMTGNDNGTFGVDSTLNRAEAATLIQRTMNKLDALGVQSL